MLAVAVKLLNVAAEEVKKKLICVINHFVTKKLKNRVNCIYDIVSYCLTIFRTSSQMSSSGDS